MSRTPEQIEANLAECERLVRMRHHNATTSEQRQEVIRRLAAALEENWDGDCTWQTLGQFLARWVGSDVEQMKDTEIVAAVEGAPYGGGEPGEWATFPQETDEWRAELRRRYFDPELRHSVDVNDLRARGVIGEEE